MVICPFCKAENIDGVDECEHCQQPLGFLSKPRASSPIEHSLSRTASTSSARVSR